MEEKNEMTIINNRYYMMKGITLNKNDESKKWIIRYAFWIYYLSHPSQILS